MLLLSKSQKLKKGSLALNMFFNKIYKPLYLIKAVFIYKRAKNKIDALEKYFCNNG